MMENEAGGEEGRTSEGSRINFPLKLIVTTAVVLLVLFALYWSGRQLFYQPGESGNTRRGGQLPLAVAECENIYTDLKQALIDSGRDKIPVCGFDISGNRYMNFTEAISTMDSLIVIRANDNVIGELPNWIGQLEKLRVIELRNNRIKAVPDSIGELRALEVLDLRGNPMPREEVEKARSLVPQAEVLF